MTGRERPAAALLRATHVPLLDAERRNLADVIEALAAERDAALLDARDFERQSEIAYAERDALRAEVQRARAEEREACLELMQPYLALNSVGWFERLAAAIRARGEAGA